LRFDNRHQGRALVSRQGAQKPFDVTVNQPDDGDPDWLVITGGFERRPMNNESAERGSKTAKRTKLFIHGHDSQRDCNTRPLLSIPPAVFRMPEPIV
jgi:hypothetical protein